MIYDLPPLPASRPDFGKSLMVRDEVDFFFFFSPCLRSLTASETTRETTLVLKTGGGGGGLRLFCVQMDLFFIKPTHREEY